MKTIAVLAPVLRRPQNVRPLIDSLNESTDDATLYFIANDDDVAELDEIRAAGGNVILCPDVSWAKKINYGFKNTVEPWVLLGADDIRFRPGWVETVRNDLESFYGVIGTNDLGNINTMTGTTSTHPLVNRKYVIDLGTIDVRGDVVHAGYHHNYPDTELCETAKHRGMYKHRLDCCIEHFHPAWGKAVDDEVYLLGRARLHEDSLTFAGRMAHLRNIPR